MKLVRLPALLLGLATLAGPALAGGSPAGYGALAPLIGQWNVGPDGGATAFIQRFSWGPKEAYVWVQVGLILESGEEHLHFEGPILWNGATRRYDYLFSVEPGSLTQEQGEIHVTGDGEIIREVILTAADGATSRFRQTFRALQDGRFITTLMRQTADGWSPTFPGSERLIMTRCTS
jgi:hypothetical protein